MIIKRTETIYLKYDNQLSYLCHISKNLYNEGNYLIRQEFINNGKWLRYKDLDKQLKDNKNYKYLPTQTSQQILKLLEKNWKSFFKSIKDWKKNPDKYNGKPNLPKYKNKNGEYLLIFTNQQCKIKDGILKFPKLLNLQIKTRLNNVKLNQVRIIPMGVGYRCEIIYEKETKELNLNKDNVAGIDLGIDNIVTVANNIGQKPIVIKGGIVKSINQYFNKRLADLKSFYDKINIQMTNKIKKLYHKRNLKMNDFFHKTSKNVIDYCIKNDIGTLIIGYNKQWKTECNIGKMNNQKFVQIPYFKLINQLKYKAEEVGINTIEQEESYTSKCSFLDDEPIQRKDEYCGKRIKRGLFKSLDGTVINADLNGAYNIIKKAIPHAFKGIEGVALHPMGISHEYN